jgi:hypothetical protein
MKKTEDKRVSKVKKHPTANKPVSNQERFGDDNLDFVIIRDKNGKIIRQK